MKASEVKNSMESKSDTPSSTTIWIDAHETVKAVFTLNQELEAGSLIRVRGNKSTMFSQFCFLEMQLVSNEQQFFPIVHHYTTEERHADWGLYSKKKSLAVIKTPVYLPKGAKLRAIIKPATVPIAAPGLSGQWELAAINNLEDTEGQLISSPFSVHFIGGEVNHVEVHQTKGGKLRLYHRDAAGYPAGIKQKDSIEEKKTVDNINGRFHIRTALGYEAFSQVRPKAMDGTPIFFGDMHWHTEFSDGQQTLDAGMRNARDLLGLDFAGPGDHMGVRGRFGEIPYSRQAEQCGKFQAPGQFSVLPSCEVGFRHGHVNLITESFELMQEILARFPDTILPAIEKNPDRYPWEAILSLCPPGKAILSPAHPAVDSGTVTRPEDKRVQWYSFNWPQKVDLQIARSVEIMREWTSSETEEIESNWPSSKVSYGGSVRTALTRGYRLGFSGRSDSHKGWPGRGGLTAVQAPENTLESIFQAIYRRRTYATSGSRIVADATLNGYPMGSELQLQPSEPRRLRIVIHASAPLEQVQIISAGVPIADFPIDSETPDFETEWTDDRPGRFLDNVYYYVRARQVDGQCIWLSPFWVDLPA